MNDTFTAKLAGVFVLLSMAAEFAAIGLVVSHGVGVETLAQMDFSTREQLVMLQQARWMIALFSLGVIAPCLAMLVWSGVYQVLAPGGAAAFWGVIVSSLGFLFAVIGEAIRLAVVITLPPAYVGAADVARPGMLALGVTLGSLIQILRNTSMITIYAVGMPLIALAILRGCNLPSWFGWVLLIPSALVGYIGAPLVSLGRAIGGPFIGLGLNIHFLWLLMLAFLLLRWRPSHNKLEAGAGTARHRRND